MRAHVCDRCGRHTSKRGGPNQCGACRCTAAPAAVINLNPTAFDLSMKFISVDETLDLLRAHLGSRLVA